MSRRAPGLRQASVDGATLLARSGRRIGTAMTERGFDSIQDPVVVIEICGRLATEP